MCVHGLVHVYTTVCAHPQAGTTGGVLYTWFVFLEANLFDEQIFYLIRNKAL